MRRAAPFDGVEYRPDRDERWDDKRQKTWGESKIRSLESLLGDVSVCLAAEWDKGVAARA